MPWPHKMYVADQIGEERRERERAAIHAESVRRHEEALAYAAHTRRRADEETRKHAVGLPCDVMFCRATEHLPLWHAALGDGALCGLRATAITRWRTGRLWIASAASTRGDVMAYQPKHARHPDPTELPAILRGLADQIEVLNEEEDR